MASRVQVYYGRENFELLSPSVKTPTKETISRATWLGKSIKILKKSVNKRSLINFLNNHDKNLKLKRGWFFGYGGSSDSDVIQAFNTYVKKNIVEIQKDPHQGFISDRSHYFEVDQKPTAG